ncbi:MAG: hypothetical protein IT175_07320 [Acidobacteria bacterium]|nr:hypothetical protein [Acidobacteriota bacterium]
MAAADSSQIAGVRAPDGGHLDIRLCGTFRIALDGVTVDEPALRRSKVRAVVAMLALAPAHRVRRERLADAIWPDLDGDGAANQLAKSLHLLRRALEPELAPRAASRFLAIRNGFVELTAPGGVRVDVDEFRTLARLAIESGDRSRIESAVAKLPDGSLSEWSYLPCAMAMQAELGALAARLLERASELAERAGDERAAESHCRRLLDIEPCSEPASRGLMRAAWRRGDRTGALRIYSSCLTVLRSELGVDPSPETAELAGRVASEPFAGIHMDSSPLEKSVEPVATDRVVGSAATVESDPVSRLGVPGQERPGTLAGQIRSFVVRMAGGTATRAATASLLIVATFGFVAATTPGRALQRASRGAFRSAVAMVTGSPSEPPLVVLTGRGVAPNARVDVVGSRSGLAAYAGADGRFQLPGVWYRPGTVYRIAVSADDEAAAFVDVAVDGPIAADGSVDLGEVPMPDTNDAGRVRVSGLNSFASIDFPDVGGAYGAGVVRAITVSCDSDAERVAAIDSFVASLYVPTALDPRTPREVVELGSGRASDLSDAMAALAGVAGFRSRLVDVGDPANAAMTYPLVEVFYDGGWHVFDPASATRFREADGAVPSHAEVRGHPSWVRLDPTGQRTYWNAGWLMGIYRSPLHRYRIVDDARILES